MYQYRVGHGDFKGGVSHTDVAPTITTSAYEHNNFIIRICRYKQEEI